jgi:3-methyladenine DNA glycosylase AlkC
MSALNRQLSANAENPTQPRLPYGNAVPETLRVYGNVTVSDTNTARDKADADAAARRQALADRMRRKDEERGRR